MWVTVWKRLAVRRATHGATLRGPVGLLAVSRPIRARTRRREDRRWRSFATVLLGTLGALFALACGKTTGDRLAETPKPEEHSATPAHVHWGYEGADGPQAWGSLDPKFVACAEGQSQSPIDLDAKGAGEHPPMATKYGGAELRIVHHAHLASDVNTGHSIQVNFAGGDTLVLGNDRYALAQFHFHSPSEHTVQGVSFPMEMHLVHKAADGRLAVVGVFIAEGAHNAAFDPIWRNLPQQQGVEQHLEDVEFDIEALLPKNRSAYRYEGSLTTPPCSEGLAWSVCTEPIQLSAEQIATFRKVMHGNNRPVQPLHGRSVSVSALQGATSP